MDLEKKATILFPVGLYEHLGEVARQRGISVGQLVREACVTQYGTTGRQELLDAASELVSMTLPVGTVEEMIDESLPGEFRKP